MGLLVGEFGVCEIFFSKVGYASKFYRFFFELKTVKIYFFQILVFAAVLLLFLMFKSKYTVCFFLVGIFFKLKLVNFRLE